MKHPHYEMIVAKAANMDLVIFYRYKNDEWEEAASEMLVWDVKAEHFLCLPQHKEACLHWLNGGELQINRKTYNEQGEELPSEGFLNWDRPSRGWKHTVGLMSDKCQFRIKPKKEKRWLSIRRADLLVDDKPYKTRGEAEAANSPAYWNHYELLIEV